EAMHATQKVALAQFISHGKEQLVLIRPYQDGLVLHQMYYADEVRSFDEVDKGGGVKVRANEVELARKLIEQLSEREFKPDKFEDTYRDRVKAAVEQKVAGEEVRMPEAPAARAQVIDLMQALKESLAHRGAKPEEQPQSAAMRGLLEKRVPVRQIGAILASLRRQIGERPITRLSVYADGRRVVAWDGASRWQPDSGQFLFNFDAAQVMRGACKVAHFRAPAR